MSSKCCGHYRNMRAETASSRPKKEEQKDNVNRPFPSSKKSHFQSEAKYEVIDMKMIFNCDANKTHFHNKGFALSLVLNVRYFGTRKWPIARETELSSGKIRQDLRILTQNSLTLSGVSIPNPLTPKKRYLPTVTLNRLALVFLA